MGDYLLKELAKLVQKYPSVVRSSRGVGLMLGLELQERSQIPGMAASEKAPSLQLVQKLHEAGLLTIPSGTQVLRLLPPLNLAMPQAEEGLQILDSEISKLA